ncbi:MAG: sterol desaturase family protein [Pseudomonadales bacterium]|nr:sterol desaturase family protein [Pseudomonadales bacterium]
MLSLDSFWGLLSVIDNNTIAMIVAFDVLVIASLVKEGGWGLLRRRVTNDWVLDLSGLLIQGALIPWLQVAVIVVGLGVLVPQYQGTWNLPGWLAFGVCFVLVDYAYYWNHRLFHKRKLWTVHKVHHSATQMDVFNTSRNTLWTSFLIVYLWLNGIMIYLLADPYYYILAITVTAILDLWRHSRLQPKGGLEKILGSFLILPKDHAWHHSQDIYDVNFGANLNFWDRLHGTLHRTTAFPVTMGVDDGLSLSKKLWWPIK